MIEKLKHYIYACPYIQYDRRIKILYICPYIQYDWGIKIGLLYMSMKCQKRLLFLENSWSSSYSTRVRRITVKYMLRIQF